MTDATSDRHEGGIDLRGPRFGAAVPSVLLIIGVCLSATSTSPTLPEVSLTKRVLDPGYLVQLMGAVLFAWSPISAKTQPLSPLFRVLVQPHLSLRS